MDRRRFLQQSSLALPGLWLRAAGQPPPRIIVAGAGLAGLAAALQLHEAGCDVAIVEARTRPGGRVYTIREPFSDGLYADAGAARIQDSHEYTLAYVKRLNLTLDPFWPTEGNTITCIDGTRIASPAGTPVDLAKVPLDFLPEERTLGLRGCLVKYLFSFVKDIGDPKDARWPTEDVSRFEVPLPEFCRRQGASPAFLRMLAFGHDLSAMSALHFLRDTALGLATKQWFKIRGGNDRLPAAMAALLSDRIRYGAPIVRIGQDAAGVRVTYLRARTPVTEPADYLVCTLPLPVLREIEVAPALSAAKRAAIPDVGSFAMARVFLQTRRRFWLDRGDSGWAATDDPMDVWDYSRGQPGTRGILGAYLSGAMTRTVTPLSDPDRGRFVLERMERAHPGVMEQFEGSASKSWIDDPWARGAGAEFGPGQLSRHYAALRAPEGRIYFAGEHTSPWSGWMNGALESGRRAADGLLARLAHR